MYWKISFNSLIYCLHFICVSSRSSFLVPLPCYDTYDVLWHTEGLWSSAWTHSSCCSICTAKVWGQLSNGLWKTSFHLQKATKVFLCKLLISLSHHCYVWFAFVWTLRNVLYFNVIHISELLLSVFVFFMCKELH